MNTNKNYQSFHPDHEISVHFLLNMKNAINSERYASLFEKAGLMDKQADEWIPFQTFLDILNELENQGGAMLDFVAIGMKAISQAVFPPEFTTLPFEAKMSNLGSQHPHFNRGTNYGYIKDNLVAQGHMQYHIFTPFPDNWWYGIFYGGAKRFLPPNSRFKVYYDKDKLRREEGGDETIIHVEWWEKEDK
jgi:hypothetical protein